MKYQNSQFIFSPTDLSGYINCKALTFYNKEAVLGKRVRPVFTNRVTQLLQERGIAFENSYLEKLAAEGKKILTITQDDPDAFENTQQGMRDGYEIIYQARLKMNAWQGWADFLIKAEGQSDFGDWSYEVADTKLASETKAATILQITMYSEMIKFLQGSLPECMHVITPDGEHTYRVADYLFYVQYVKTAFLKAMDSGVEIYPDVVAHCDLCNWWEECNKRRRLDDHLSFIAGISKQHIKEVRTREVNTLVAMAELPMPVEFTPSRGSKESYAKVRDQSRVQRLSRELKKPVHEMLPRIAGMGLFRLPEPSQWDIYLDLEGDPMVEPAGREYIIGWHYQDTYHIRWAETAEQEKEAFENFIDFATSVQEEHPESHIYHYGSYEVSAFKRLMCRYATRENEMDNFLRSGKFIDLLNVVKQSLRAGVERYSLKDLEKYHRFVREMDLRTMSPIKADYDYLLQVNMLEEATEEMREVIKLYNKDDCVSTKHLHTWLEDERQKLVSTGEVIGRPEIKIGEAGENITQHQERINYESKLRSVAGLENQRLEGNTRFAGSGLFLEAVAHNSNTSRSVEEVDAIEAIVKDLCKGDVYWNDKDNKRVKLTKEHIRIIAPYNAQVHELGDRIPGVALGTVDKFQGQEASVVIFSMTTSSPHDAPRGMDFLYSPNRFNVAVSRARAVFIMVASPALLEAECKSPDQIKLVNAFCRYWEVAKKTIY